jgi:hypothetical protein
VVLEGKRTPRRWFVAFAVAASLMVAAASIVYAASTASGNAVTAVRVASDGNSVSTQSTTATPVPGMSVTIKVPSGEHGLLLATFAAESRCTAAIDTVAGCWVEVLMDGYLLATPNQVQFISDGYNDDTDDTAAHSMQFYFTNVAPGVHTVKVQFRVTHPAATFTVNYRTFSVLRSRQP